MAKDFLSTWKSQLNLLWCGQTLLMSVMAMSLPYWPLYIAQLGNYSEQAIRYWSAAIYLAPFITSIFSSPLWGKWGSKYGHKTMVLRAALGLFLTQLFIGLTQDLSAILIARLLQGILAGFIVSAQTWALAISPDTARGFAIGKVQSATAIGNLLGPVFGGIIASYAGYLMIFHISTIICAGVTIFFYLVLQESQRPLFPIPQQNKTPLTFTHFITYMLVSIIILQIARAMITPIFTLFVTEQFGGNDLTIGLLYGITALMIFISATPWGKFFDKIILRPRLIKAWVFCLFTASGLMQISQAFATQLWQIFLLRLGWGICLGALLPLLLRLLADQGREAEQGLLIGFGNSATKFGNLVGIIIGTAIEFTFGFSETFLFIGLLYILGGIIVFKILPQTQVAFSHDH